MPRTPGRAVQEYGVGLVPVRIEDDTLAFAAPPLIRSGPVGDADLSVALVVLVLEPDLTARAGQQSIGVVGLYPRGIENDSADAAVEVRAFFNDRGGPLREDPVTGSLNASVAQWLTSSGRVKAPYVARQGTGVGRDGRVRVTEAEGELWIAGSAVGTVGGDLDL